MKNKIFKILALTLVFCLTVTLAVSCAQPCTHEDEDGDNVCDLCSEELEGATCSHEDGDGDDVCDLCGEELEGATCTHEDGDGDDVCDLCGEQLTDTPTKEELLAAADAALAGGHYKITTGFTAECNNPRYSADIRALFEGSTVEILVQGDNIEVDMPGEMSLINIRMVGNVAYVRYLDYEVFQSLRVKATMSADQREQLRDMLPTEPRLSVYDFTETVVSADGTTLTCTDLSPSVYEEVYADMDISGAIDGISNVVFADVTMTVTFADGKYDSLVIDYALSCNIDGEAVSVKISATMDYSYGDIGYVISPEDANNYKLTDFDSLMSLFA